MYFCHVTLNITGFCYILQPLISNGINNEDFQQSLDILTQAMATIKTPVKRRITPMTISTTVEGVVFQGSQDKPATVIADSKSHQVGKAYKICKDYQCV